MKIGELYLSMKEKLQVIYPNSEAEIITNLTFEHFTGLSKIDIRLKKELDATEEQTAILLKALKELLQHKPIQYVLGEAWFCGMKFLVNEWVLIPRPETEELVEWVLKEIKQTYHQTSLIRHLHILDIGTGSGCIPITIKKKLASTEITSIDISKPALKIAQQNSIQLNTKIDLIELDFLNENNWIQLKKYDIIISNPPYIPIKEKKILNKNVIDWEPSLALFVADNNPLIFYQKIASFAKKHINKNGIIYLEIHQDYSLQTKALLQQQGYKTELKKDINENDRMIKCSLKDVE